MKIKKHNVKTERVQLSWLDLEDLKEVCRKILETNIAVNSFQSKHTMNDEQKNIMQQSIYSAQQGLKKLEDVENVESINAIVMGAVGEKNWSCFTWVLSVVSGSLNDPSFYNFDKSITKDKVNKTMGKKGSDA